MFERQAHAPAKQKIATADGLLVGVVLAVSLLTLIRFALVDVIELLPEEAYYWMYSKHPSLGYFDHPPMVAWVITLGTSLFGDTQLGVRLGTYLLWIASCGLLFLTGKLWFGRPAALTATLLFALAPVFIGMGLIVTPDVPLLFFWLATLYFITRALHTNRGNYWLLAGVALGGALLSKYYALLLVPSTLLFLALSPTYRPWFRRAQFWLSLPIAVLVFSPVIVWNAQHDWVSFLFQSTRAIAPQKHMLRDVVWFWGVQGGMLGPVLFFLFAYAAAVAVTRGWTGRDDRWNFVASFSLPLFLFFAAVSFKTEIRVNWTAPAFLSLACGAGAIAADNLFAADVVRAKRWRIGSWLAVTLSLLFVVLAHTSLAWGFPKLLAYARTGGWRMLAREVQQAQETLERKTGQQAFVLGMDRYNIAAELGFYLRLPNECVNEYALGERGLAFRYWIDLKSLEERPAIAVLTDPDEESLTELRRHFDCVQEPTRIALQRRGARIRYAYLAECHRYHAQARSTQNPFP